MPDDNTPPVIKILMKDGEVYASAKDLIWWAKHHGHEAVSVVDLGFLMNDAGEAAQEQFPNNQHTTPKES